MSGQHWRQAADGRSRLAQPFEAGAIGVRLSLPLGDSDGGSWPRGRRVPGGRLLDRARPATVGICGPRALSSRFSPPAWALLRRSPRRPRTRFRPRISPAPALAWAPRSRARSCRLLRLRQEGPAVRRRRPRSGPIRACGQGLAACAPRSLCGSPCAKPPGTRACWPPTTGSKCLRPHTPGRCAGRRSLRPRTGAEKARRSGCGCRRRQPAGASPATRLPCTCSAAPTARRLLPASRRLHVPSSPLKSSMSVKHASRCAESQQKTAADFSLRRNNGVPDDRFSDPDAADRVSASATTRSRHLPGTTSALPGMRLAALD